MNKPSLYSPPPSFRESGGGRERCVKIKPQNGGGGEEEEREPKKCLSGQAIQFQNSFWVFVIVGGVFSNTTVEDSAQPEKKEKNHRFVLSCFVWKVYYICGGKSNSRRSIIPSTSPNRSCTTLSPKPTCDRAKPRCKQDMRGRRKRKSWGGGYIRTHKQKTHMELLDLQRGKVEKFPPFLNTGKIPLENTIVFSKRLDCYCAWRMVSFSPEP